ncbi:MAG: hypothetical protein KatS3mg057_2732 [Herpetosiphonaceae bacterium]|nr:MAG: hypothetical protein KatS3mg057_2732 [Herpetosiphonaceae bacterium]
MRPSPASSQCYCAILILEDWKVGMPAFLSSGFYACIHQSQSWAAPARRVLPIYVSEE